MSLLATWGRLLSFRATADELNSLSGRHLAAGLVATWLAGIGRYWDHPKASLLQHLGVGSLAYVVALSTLLWLLTWPLRPKDWSWRRVLTFVTMTSPPALLYAIPVERLMPLKMAVEVNAWFLGIVAAWRVALWYTFLVRGAGLRWRPAIPATLLPLTGIVVSLALLNLEHAVFEVMAGNIERTPADGAYVVVLILGILSLYALLPLLLWFALESWPKTTPAFTSTAEGGPASPPAPSGPPPQSPS